MGRAGKQVVQEGSDEDDVPLARRKRKVGASAQGPRGRGRTNPPAAPRRSTSQGHRARTKQAHQLDDHYDDYEDISLDTLSTFVLSPSRPPRPATTMGILKKVDYTGGSHNVYKERYTDPALWQKEFDVDIRFWLKFNADWYETVILSKENMTIDMKSINWDILRSLNIPTVNEAIDICVGVLDRQTYQGGTRGSRLCGEDRDRETENSKVCARTRDTRFIQVRAAKVANPTSCLGGSSMAPCAWCWVRSGPRLGTQPSFI
jgi:hypothetical protein